MARNELKDNSKLIKRDELLKFLKDCGVKEIIPRSSRIKEMVDCGKLKPKWRMRSQEKLQDIRRRFEDLDFVKEADEVEKKNGGWLVHFC